MAQTLPEGAAISAADIERIIEGLVELQVGKKAHAIVKVQVDLNFHHAYPKFVEFQGSSKIVQSEAEEMAFLSAVRLLDVPALPSAADLDAVAEEQKAVEATKSGAQAAYVEAYIKALENACQRNDGNASIALSIDANDNAPVEPEPPTPVADPVAVLTDVADPHVTDNDPSVASEPEKV